MNRLLKLIAYSILFVVCFVVFLYWVFPYDSLKQRLINGIERQFGGGVEVSAGELEPYWFTGVEVKKLTLNARDAHGAEIPLLALDRVRVRASLISLLIGTVRVSYGVKAGDGEVGGNARQTEEGLDFDADFDNFDVAAIKILSSRYGLNLAGSLTGSISMKLNQQNLARSTGKVSLDLKNFKIAASTLKIGPMEMPLPDLALTKSGGSHIEFDLNKGAAQIDKFKIADGDLGLDLTGKIFLSNTLSNSRFNVKGNFTVSQGLSTALPFLFVVEKEKQSDGTYPLSVTGRVSSPTIKVGNFTLPL